MFCWPLPFKVISRHNRTLPASIISCDWSVTCAGENNILWDLNYRLQPKHKPNITPFFGIKSVQGKRTCHTEPEPKGYLVGWINRLIFKMKRSSWCTYIHTYLSKQICNRNQMFMLSYVLLLAKHCFKYFIHIANIFNLPTTIWGLGFIISILQMRKLSDRE